MKIIGITGGIGSGKSTVTKILKDLGARVADADVLAREALSRESSGLREAVICFGQEILGTNGELDRKKLAAIVFADPEKRKVLESITHSYVIKRMLEIIQDARLGRFEGNLVLDVPIPIKHGFLDTVDETWVVTADRETRIKRVMERSNLAYAEVEDRIRSQMSDSQYEKLADRLIVNNGDLESLRKQVMRILEQ